MYNRSAQQVVYSVNGKREWGGGMTREESWQCVAKVSFSERERESIFVMCFERSSGGRESCCA